MYTFLLARCILCTRIFLHSNLKALTVDWNSCFCFYASITKICIHPGADKSFNILILKGLKNKHTLLKIREFPFSVRIHINKADSICLLFSLLDAFQKLVFIGYKLLPVCNLGSLSVNAICIFANLLKLSIWPLLFYIL